jgi:hypothetical protein
LRKFFLIALAATCALGAVPAIACQPDRYLNSDQHCTPRLDHNNNPAKDEPITANCRDGTVSHSHHHAGTCSSHGGVLAFRSPS